MLLRDKVLLEKIPQVSAGCSQVPFCQGRQQRACRNPKDVPSARYHLLPSQIKAFYGNEAENILISNLKRGIISLFQLQLHAGTTVEVGPELGPYPPKIQGCTRRAGPGAQPAFPAEGAKFRINNIGSAAPTRL